MVNIYIYMMQELINATYKAMMKFFAEALSCPLSCARRAETRRYIQWQRITLHPIDKYRDAWAPGRCWVVKYATARIQPGIEWLPKWQVTGKPMHTAICMPVR